VLITYQQWLERNLQKSDAADGEKKDSRPE
jgi:hypothetical protein